MKTLVGGGFVSQEWERVAAAAAARAIVESLGSTECKSPQGDAMSSIQPQDAEGAVTRPLGRSLGEPSSGNLMQLVAVAAAALAQATAEVANLAAFLRGEEASHRSPPL